MAKRRKVRQPRRHHATVMLRRTIAPGTSPGTLAVEPGGLPSKLELLAYGPTTFIERPSTTLAEIAQVRAQHQQVWINVVGVQDAHSIQGLGELFGLHPLALEDVVHIHQRPKVEAYPGATFIVLRWPREGEHLELEQVSLFLGRDFVLTFQERPSPVFDPVAARLRDGRGRLRQRGVDYLAYALVDAVVDHYFPTLERYGDRLEEVEGEIIAYPEANSVADLHALRHDLQLLRHVLWPTRDALSTLTREETGFISAETRIFLRDCHDHTIQLLDIVEACRDLASGLMDLYLSGVSLRMNEVMKVLTLIATIFIPLSFIAGLYGMNFDTARSPWNQPELRWRYGYPFALGLMALTALGLLYYFRRKGWLGSRPSSSRTDRTRHDTAEL